MRKKHSKCLLAALMALMMLLSLAGCGGNTTVTDTDSKDPTVQTDNAESKNATDTKTDSAAQKDAAKDGETADSAKTDDTKKDAGDDAGAGCTGVIGRNTDLTGHHKNKDQCDRTHDDARDQIGLDLEFLHRNSFSLHTASRSTAFNFSAKFLC